MSGAYSIDQQFPKIKQPSLVKPASNKLKMSIIVKKEHPKIPIGLEKKTFGIQPQPLSKEQ